MQATTDPAMTAAMPGTSDPAMVAAWLRGQIGRRLVAVTEARYWYNGERDPDTAVSLLHLWLHVEGRPPVMLHGSGDRLTVSTCDPYAAYDVGDDGETRVAPAAAPDLMAGLVGQQINDAAIILGHDGPSVTAGMLLRMDDTVVVIGTAGDEWFLAHGEQTALMPNMYPQEWLAPSNK